MTIKYLDAARQGKNQWWRYISILTIVPFVPACCISIVLIIWLHFFGNVSFSDLQNKVLVSKIIRTMPPGVIYLLNISLTSSICACILLGIQKIHQRDFLATICPNHKFKIDRYAKAFIVWFLISLLFRILQLKLDPQAFQDFRLVFKPIDWSIYLVPAIINAISIAFCTEVIRGYILQGLGTIVRHKYLLIIVSGLLSSLLVLLIANKAQCSQLQCMVFNLILGIGLATAILKENSLELVLGIQTAVSLLPIFLTYQYSESPPSSLPTIFSATLNSQLISSIESTAIVVLSIKLAIFYAIFWRKTPTSNL